MKLNETLNWLSSLPTLMQESFWWWQQVNMVLNVHRNHKVY